MLRALGFLFGFLVLVGVLGAGGVLAALWHYGRGLPDYQQLADYQPATVSRVHAGDGRLLAEFAVEKRVFVPIQATPKTVIKAFLAAEDKHFYNHPGVNFLSIIRAAADNVQRLAQGRRMIGASTITQQVAKNFLLTNEVSLQRKIKEAILAIRIERTFEKDRILELYLNEIYLGIGSYGVAAAALNYFDRSLTELSIAEAAFLAALPKAPNNYHPRRRPEAAKERRDWVIARMLEERFISDQEAAAAVAEPIEMRGRSATQFARADYFAEEVRRELIERYGEDGTYKGGLSVRTSLDPRLQEIADRVLRQGLEAYDRRHGWRGPIAQLGELGEDWADRLAKVEVPEVDVSFRVAVVTKVNKAVAEIAFSDGALGEIPLGEMKWARKALKKGYLGPQIARPKDVVAVGDVIVAEPVEKDRNGKAYPANSFALRQIPKINGALVALDPHTGRVLAMAGGYAYAASEYNRATQANRQPGSAFKPFVYLAAMDGGFTPATMVLDAPIVIDQGPGLDKWKPANYTNKFYGPSTLRIGLEKSRNLMTVRLAQTMGMETVATTAERFGIVDRMPRHLSMALGAGETTLLRLTSAYAMLVNGGRQITPSLIDRVQDRHGATIYRHDTRRCDGCRAEYWQAQAVPDVPDDRQQLVSPATAYQVVSMLQGVVERGTGRKVAAVGKPLAGKTGTTNESRDTWFVGFSPDLAVGVFAGFDEPAPLGKKETGSSVASPIFRDFMAEALADRAAVPFRIPPGIRFVRINAESGARATAFDAKVILEAFQPGTEPNRPDQQVLDPTIPVIAPAVTVGTGGLY